MGVSQGRMDIEVPRLFLFLVSTLNFDKLFIGLWNEIICSSSAATSPTQNRVALSYARYRNWINILRNGFAALSEMKGFFIFG